MDRVPQIIVLKPGQVRDGAEVLAESHADYPAFTHVFPDPLRRSRALLPFFEAAVRDAIPFGTVFGALESGRVHGIAVWLPPGTFPWSTLRKLRATPAFMKVWAADRRNFRAFTELGINSERHHPVDRHWSLEVLGIRPAAQRTGLGTRLLMPALERADAEGIECYLETSNPNNVAYYSRFGFQVVDRLSLVAGGPAHISMRRAVGAGAAGVRFP